MTYAILCSNGKLHSERFESLHRAKCYCKYQWKSRVYVRVKAIVVLKEGEQIIVAKPLYKQLHSWYNYSNN